MIERVEVPKARDAAGRVAIALRGAIATLAPSERERLMRRASFGGSGDGAAPADLVERVAELIADVRARGDAALLAAAERFDGARPAALEVPRTAWDAALGRLAPAQRAALEQAAAAIARVHEAQVPIEQVVEPYPGVRVGRRPDPLARVGVYAPGGRAAYPSSVLMGAVPARVARVAEVIVCSPATSSGAPHDAVLAACAIAGVDRVFATGGASAIAALAYGTETVPAVDRIVGPGSAWVDEAKRQVGRVVGIDNPAGPSELLVMCDDSADPAGVAAELIAQAEHGADAAVVLLALGARVAAAVEAELALQLARAPRGAIAAAALDGRGALLFAESLDEAIAFANAWAAEHLLLRVRDGDAVLARVRNAGAVFVGESTSVAQGDYLTGANHVLPTSGAARFWSGLSVSDFVRWTSWQTVTPAAAQRLASPLETLALLEELPGHAAAARRAAGAVADVPAPARLPEPRAPFVDFERYQPGRRDLPLELSANTNRWGPSPAVLGVLAGLGGGATEALTEYTTPYADELRAAIARELGLAPGNVSTGCGSDDVIDSALRAFCPPGSVLAHPTPTFPMAPVFARMNDLRTVTVPLQDDGGFDVARVVAARPSAVYVCSPNNPTGQSVPAGVIEALLDACDALVLIDEAYADFAESTLLELALASERALVTRTFSKAAGLAGARVGYALGAPRLIAAVEAARGPYKVGALGERLARAALADRDWRERVVSEARAARERLTEELRARGLRVWPSQANFVLFSAGDGVSRAGESGAARPETGTRTTAPRLAAELRAHGVGVRAFAEPAPSGALRVTVAPEAEMRRFLDALDAVLGVSACA